MPPKDFAAKKKSRVEVRKEFHLALQRWWQQQQQASQHADGPLGSQQELPVLPLALPTPSTHSTTGNTGTISPTPPIRSIRCSFATTHLPAKKKSRVEGHKELHLALKQQWQQQQRQASQHVDRPSGSQQELPVLPLALPTPSTHSMTGNTVTISPAPPIRSIRCSFATTHLPGKKKSRVEVRKELHLALQQRWQQQQQHADGPLGSQQELPVLPLALPTPSTHSTTGNTGTIGPAPPIRSIRCSFVTTHLPAKKKSRVEVRKELHLALQQRWQQQHADGPSGSQQESPVLPLALPTPSTHSTTGNTGTISPTPPIRSIRCSFATTHLPTESGTAGAFSSNKRRGVVVGKKTETIIKEKGRTLVTYDSGGAKPFVVRAEEYKKKGEQAPHSKTYIGMYKKFDPESTSKVQHASMLPIEDTSNGSSTASITIPPLLRHPVDVEIGVMERMVGPSRGTRVPGLGSGVAKQSRKRGLSQPTKPKNETVEKELARLRANQKNLEEHLQQQKREREMERKREREEREREREERERERLVWEARMQAQFEEMARQMRMGASPSDGSNFAP